MIQHFSCVLRCVFFLDYNSLKPILLLCGMNVISKLSMGHGALKRVQDFFWLFIITCFCEHNFSHVVLAFISSVMYTLCCVSQYGVN